ncbi:hypothetical protein TVAG_470100 [Trichomonas vaginalis G3]|uniref:Uncharacterized protein n=1 Tax=Trichomonas vaginalis (strain ATCC PRA-98 / G3) TaxID=412133 RepID=A2FE17_TRIV3|nr:hypothetical protein TVAGG3_0553520 [Trichomonas vaginalis G3]EAX96845.1 hypothetical protein TVAG_470100 [Trichomonas vaginalis G3]KAI5520690.1 hypothetical protein TVAGG3_0553520 [Trichomonas vaginalis G3]|eukprot:XP_001309775.1 hypothetical protein [Trichomonas vaginalis G3]
MTETIDWKKKYEEMEKNYKDMESIRIHSVIADIDDLQSKIEEHERVNTEIRNELEQENEQIKAKIREVNRMKKEIDEINSKIALVKKSIHDVNPVLEVLAGYSKFNIDIQEKNYFIIRINTKICFSLKSLQELEYQPIQGLDQIPNKSLRASCQLNFRQLPKLCDQVLQYSEQPSN